jgi:phosphoribosylformylglycinamidine synthase II
MAKKFQAWSDIASLQDAVQHGLKPEEFDRILSALGREVNVLEVGICSALFSEHCSYKSSKVHLKTLPTTGPRVIQGPGENAGVIDIGDGEAVCFKIESHNHPSFIEPYQGAATGVGGILRDVFTMGARPVALMNGLRFGLPSNERTSYLVNRAVAGIGGYGNRMGIPTVGGELYFHESYNGNCLVNAFALGLVDTDKIFLGTASGIGNPIFYVGSKTGRDGIHGATMSSESFDEGSEEKRPTVQVGDPFQEKLLLEACLELMESGAVVGIQDMGAAGMTSSTYEMAERAGTGVRIDLDHVPMREEGMTPYDIMLSESQERMLVVVEKGKEKIVTDIFERWGLDAVQIGRVVEGDTVDLYWENTCISSIPVAVVTSSVPEYRWPEKAPENYEERACAEIDWEEPSDLSALWLEMLGEINLCSRHQVYRQYDSTVRSNTVLHPGGDAAVIRVKSGRRPEKGVAMTLDCNSRYCGIDPRLGAAHSVAESYRNISAVGAEAIGVSDCLNFGSPENPTGMWELAEGIRGLGDACRAFSLPIVSGNVSLNNENKGKGILPTPMVAMVGLIADASQAMPAHFQSEGDCILLLGDTRESEIGGSELAAKMFPALRGKLPILDYDREMLTAKALREASKKSLLRSCHDVGSGGLAVALAEACLSEYRQVGACLQIDQKIERQDRFLFAETGARYLISCDPSKLDQVKKLFSTAKVPVTAIGTVGGGKITIENVASLELGQAYKRWRSGLEVFFGKDA